MNNLGHKLGDAKNRNIHLACGFCFDNAMMWQIKFVQTNLWALDWSILSIRIFVRSKNTIGCNLPHKQNSLSNYTNKHNLQFGTVCQLISPIASVINYTVLNPAWLCIVKMPWTLLLLDFPKKRMKSEIEKERKNLFFSLILDLFNFC